MTAETETLDTVQSLTQSGYKWGWETDIEMDLAPKGLNEGTIRLISVAQAGAGVAAGVAAEGVCRLAADDRAALGAR